MKLEYEIIYGGEEDSISTLGGADRGHYCL